MTIKYLGTNNGGLTGIPSLLLSSLQQIEDPNVQTALYQVQNWANSLQTLVMPKFVGFGNALVGTWGSPDQQAVSLQTAFISENTDPSGLCPITFPVAFTSVVGGVFLQDISNNSSASQDLLLDDTNPVTLSGFYARFVVNAAPLVSSPVNFLYLAIGA